LHEDVTAHVDRAKDANCVFTGVLQVSCRLPPPTGRVLRCARTHVYGGGYGAWVRLAWTEIVFSWNDIFYRKNILEDIFYLYR
jgi:hypothetical protein